MWGVERHSAELLQLQTPDTKYGVTVVNMSPTSDVVIREEASGYDSDALKVIDFYSPDFQQAQAVLSELGYELKNDVANYDIGDVNVTEGHLWAPDGVVCAVVSGSPEFFSSFVGNTTSQFSEVMSVSAPVSKPNAVIDFYGLLGFNKVYEYEVTDSSFQHLVGADEPLHIKATNMGPSKSEPYFGIIDYGLPKGYQRSLRDTAKFPNRGLVGALVEVNDLASILLKCQQAKIKVLAQATETVLQPYGQVVSASVEAPHGVMHQLIQKSC